MKTRYLYRPSLYERVVLRLHLAMQRHLTRIIDKRLDAQLSVVLDEIDKDLSKRNPFKPSVANLPNMTEEEILAGLDALSPQLPDAPKTPTRRSKNSPWRVDERNTQE